MQIPLFQVDAFTERPFHGNPAAVCILYEPLVDTVMQRIATEMNLSETAFLMREGEGFRLRWFTPRKEVDLCGHATLASVHVLLERRMVSLAGPIRFYTRSGELEALKRGEWITLIFPRLEVKAHEAPEVIVNALDIQPVFSGMSTDNYVFEVENEKIVRDLNPDFPLIVRYAPHGIAVTSRADSAGFDFVSRFFAPALGVNEDPVTGSIHCALGPYWQKKLERDELSAYQASSRGGVLKLHVKKDNVLISGQAVTVFSGNLII